MTLKQKIKNWVMGWDTNQPPAPAPIPAIDELPVPPVVLNDPAKDDTNPWVSIESTTYDPVKGFCIELNWNDAFVQYLTENGITGRTDDEKVHKWVALLYKDLVQRMEQDTLERSDIVRVNDFL